MANPTKILIQNHAEHLICLHLPVPKKATAEGPSVAQHGGEINLVPGVNEVDADMWKAAKNSAGAQAFLKMKKKGGIVELDARTIADLDVDDAIETVEETVDPALLKKWAESEKRDEVKAAIAAQFEKIDPRKNKATDSGESAS